MAVTKCVTCSREIEELIQKNGISPSKALKVGVLAIINEPFAQDSGVSVEETGISRAERIKRTMQTTINDLNLEIEKLRK